MIDEPVIDWLDLGELDSARDIAAGPIEAMRSPRRLTVSDAATKHVQTPTGPWSADLTPYMSEPMDCTHSRMYLAVCFVGPARSGKTQATAEGKLAHSVMCDPGDMGIYFPTENNAADFSKRRIDRLHQYSPDLRGMLSTRGHDNNIMSKRYRNGVMVDFLWPASSQLAQREFKTVILSDFDAMPQDVNSEGSPFDLGQKRTQTFLSSGCTIVESSPRFEVIKRGWSATTPHEAPPVAAGILPIYNRGDRRRWYWRCLECSHPFEAPALPSYEPADPIDPVRQSKTAYVPCPKCGHRHKGKDKRALNQSGRWVADGQALTPDGELVGDSPESPIASFWLLGCAAAFQPWESLVLGELHGLQEVATKGKEETLRTKRNVDQGIPYVPMTMASAREPAELQRRAETIERGIVPDGAKVLTAAVDVQGNRFVVQVEAWGPGFESWIIDRFDLALSDRTVDGYPQAVDPGAHAADWLLLADRPILSRRYTNSDGEIVPVALTVCDSGGAAGVTYNAYDFSRHMKRRGLRRRFALVKGVATVGAPALKETYPISAKKHHKSAARGDVAVLQLNANTSKDAIDHALRVSEPGPGYIHLPRWAEMSFFEEACTEVRSHTGKWEKANPGDANETWDLLYYNLMAVKYLGADSWGDDWERCQTWDVIYDDRPVAPKVTHPSATAKAKRNNSSGFAPQAWADRGFR